MAYDLGKATGVVEIDYDGRKLEKAEKDLDGVDNATGKLGGGLKKLAGIAAAAFAAIEVGSFFVDSVKGAADLEQSIGAVDAVFKQNSGQIHEWAQSAATDLGLTQNEYNELATVMGSQLKNGGTSLDELGEKTNGLMILGADMASMYGGSTREAVEALSSAMKGERDPIERYGVSLNQAAIDAKAAELGFKKVDGALSAEANQAATLALIMDQTSDAHGNFGRESGTLSNRLQVMAAQWGNLKTSIGSLFIPAITAAATVITNTVLPAIQSFVDGLSSINSDMKPVDIIAALGIDPNGPFGSALQSVIAGVQTFVAAFRTGNEAIAGSGFAGAMGQIGATARDLWDSFQQLENNELVGMLIALGGAALAVVGPGTALGGIMAAVSGAFARFAPILSRIAPLFRLLLGPVGIIITLLTTLYLTNDEFRASMDGLFGVIGNLVTTLVSQLMPVFTQLATTLLPIIADLFTQLVPIISQLLTAIVPLVGTLLTQLVPVLAQLIEAILPIVVQLITQLAPVVVQLVGAFVQLVTALLPVVSTIIDLLIPAIEWLLPIVISVFTGLVDQVIAALGIIQGVITTVTGIIKGDWGMVWEGIKQIFVGIWNFIKAWFFSILNNIGTVTGQSLSEMKTNFSTTLNAIKNFFVNIWNAIWGFIKNVLTSIKNFIVNTATNIRDSIRNAFNAARDAITNAVNKARATVISVFTAIVSKVTSAANSVRDRVRDGFNAAKERATTAVNNMKSAVTNKFNEIVNFVRNFPSRIKSAIGNLSNVLVQAGRDLLNGLRDGINDAWENVKGRLQDITGQIPDWKGPPERDEILLVEAGQLIMKGFADGIEDSIPMVRKTLQGLTNGLSAMVDVNPVNLGIDLNPRRVSTPMNSALYTSNSRGQELKLLATLAERLMEVGKTEVTLPVAPEEDRTLTGRRISEVLDLRALALSGGVTG